jgi:DNA-nicking Smr family endonuclease
LPQSLTEAPLRMDAGTHARMQRGKLAPESRIDLHGLTLAEAHPDLVHFILNAHAAGLRLVLVITGKGKLRDDHGPIPQRMGALRHQVPQWLRLPPLGPVVLQVTEAHLKHGGSGAYYVYLRRR